MERSNENHAIIQDLLPIYADGELSPASTELVEEHLNKCESCRKELAAYNKPLLAEEELALEAISRKARPYFWPRLRRFAWVGVLVVILGSGGLSWASYHAGRNIAFSDPHYRRAVKEELFTPVHQTQKIGPYEITVERILVDAAQTVVFYHTEPAVAGGERLELTVKDQEDRTYEPHSGFSYGGKDHITELDPVDSRATTLTLEFKVVDTPASGSFSVAVQPQAVQASTSEWWPGVTRKFGPVRVDLEHIVLGITKSQVELRAIWPLDQDIRGIGIGKLPPVGPKVGEDGKVRSASSSFYNVPPGIPMSPEYAQLFDVDNRRQLELETTGLLTDSTNGGTRIVFDFEPLAEATNNVQFLLPKLYLYRYVIPEQQIEVMVQAGEEKTLNKTLIADGKEIKLVSVKGEERFIELDYRIPDEGEGVFPRYLPEWVLVTNDGFETRSRRISVDSDGGRIRFYPDAKGPWTLRLKSVGEMVSGNGEFSLSVPSVNY